MSKTKVRQFTEKQIEINHSNDMKRRLKMSKNKPALNAENTQKKVIGRPFQKGNVLTTWQAYDVALGRKEAIH